MLLANLMPESGGEAMALIPSLKVGCEEDLGGGWLGVMGGTPEGRSGGTTALLSRPAPPRLRSAVCLVQQRARLLGLCAARRSEALLTPQQHGGHAPFPPPPCPAAAPLPCRSRCTHCRPTCAGRALLSGGAGQRIGRTSGLGARVSDATSPVTLPLLPRPKYQAGRSCTGGGNCMARPHGCLSP